MKSFNYPRNSVDLDYLKYFLIRTKNRVKVGLVLCFRFWIGHFIIQSRVFSLDLLNMIVKENCFCCQKYTWIHPVLKWSWWNIWWIAVMWNEESQKLWVTTTVNNMILWYCQQQQWNCQQLWQYHLVSYINDITYIYYAYKTLKTSEEFTEE